MGSRIIGHIYSHPQSNFQKLLIEYIQKNNSNIIPLSKKNKHLVYITTSLCAGQKVRFVAERWYHCRKKCFGMRIKELILTEGKSPAQHSLARHVVDTAAWETALVNCKHQAAVRPRTLHQKKSELINNHSIFHRAACIACIAYILLLNRARAIISPIGQVLQREYGTRLIADRAEYYRSLCDYEFNCRAALRQKEKIISNKCSSSFLKLHNDESARWFMHLTGSGTVTGKCNLSTAVARAALAEWQ